MQGLPGCLPWGLVMAYLNDDLQHRGLSKPLATLVVMVYGSGGLLGSIVAGVLGQRLYNWRKGVLPLLAGFAVWAGMPALAVLVNSNAALRLPPALLLAWVFMGGAVASVAGVIIRPLVMNVNMPESRGVALALQVPPALHPRSAAASATDLLVEPPALLFVHVVMPPMMSRRMV